ncbi:MAG: lipid-A-disaccharide synthase [Chitinophagaceae bacterium]|nr:lipid-A-disaccharide synthase [Chitinophagaceae bacterium]
MKYFIIAGERSGDMHGGALIQSLKEKESTSIIYCWGGESMQEAGGILLQHYKEISFMGIWEVIKHLSFIKKIEKKCQEQILEYNPDVLIYIDFPGFNLRIAAFAKKHLFTNIYYISPKVWAWNRKRVFTIKKYIDRLYCIFPFEKEFYAFYNYPVEYVGNPTKQFINQYVVDTHFLEKHVTVPSIVAVLPGSRKDEIRNILPQIRILAKHFPQYYFIVAGVDNVPTELYNCIKDISNISLEYGKTYEILKKARAAIVTSGTATLETALLNVPQMVVYKTSFLTYMIISIAIKIPFISLVNIIANKEIVKEFIQRKFSFVYLAKELVMLMESEGYRYKIQQGYKQIEETLGEFNTSDLLSEKIIQFVKEKQNGK